MIGVIVGTSIVVTIASDSGLFHFLAVRLVKLTGGRPARLMPAVMLATLGFVTFLTIAPGVLIIVFFAALFVLVGTVQETGLLEVLAAQIYAISGQNVLLAILLIVPFVFMAAIVDNIPVAATMIPVVRTMIERGLPAEPLWWSLIAACNLGGNPTPVASVAAVIALHALEKERNIRIGWGEYLRIGGGVTVLQIGLVLAYMMAFTKLGLFPEL